MQLHRLKTGPVHTASKLKHLWFSENNFVSYFAEQTRKCRNLGPVLDIPAQQKQEQKCEA